MLWSANTLELKNLAAQILQNEIGVQPCGDLQAIFWADENRNIEWVVGYTAFIGKTCQIHVVALKGGYTPKQFLKAAFDYPFNHCNLEKMFGIVNSKNLKAMEYDQKLGFKEAIRFAGVHDDGGDIVVFEMNKADCRWIRECKNEHIKEQA
jgi:RimJ/RimL family protein N-acetyltransferase